MAIDDGTTNVYVMTFPLERGTAYCGRRVREVGFEPLGFHPTYPVLYNSSAVVGSKQIDVTFERELEELFGRRVCTQKEINRFNTALQGLKIRED